MMVKNVLFLCEGNLHRSPTAEILYQDAPGLKTRSAGLSPLARIPVSEELLARADVVFVMERRLAGMLRRRFKASLAGKEVVCLDIPDTYLCMQPELLAVLTEKLTPYLGPPGEAAARSREKDAIVNETELKALEGLPIDEARQRVEGHGLLFRICSEDGEDYPITADYRTNRVNVEVAAGKVASARIG